MTLRNLIRILSLMLVLFAVLVSGVSAQIDENGNVAQDETPLYLPMQMESAFGGNTPGFRNDATEFTIARNAALYDELPFDDTSDFDDVQRGFIAPIPDDIIKLEDGSRVAWDPTQYDFIEFGSPAPDTVNPSLWRQSQLITASGLYSATDRIYQVRNYDLSNLTIIEGDTGIIVVDPLISKETAKAALDLYYSHRPQVPVVAVIYSHSHIDHYGGVKGVTSQEDVDAGDVKVVAPDGFMEHAIKENVYAGTAMTRRAFYMYGNLLPADEKGQVGAGLGTTASEGTITLIAPTDTITEDSGDMIIDGLTFQFFLAPDSEAPAEMHWYIPELRALSTAENATHTLHNVYSLRGTKVRDPLAWSKYLNTTLALWGEETDVLYGMHHWPIWGTDEVLDHLRKQRDTYRYINDQTLRLANKGYTMIEIAEMFEMPESLATTWSSRGYYGSVNHDVKAAYDKYLGWFDGNPATLNPLPPVESGVKYVEFMGGADAVLTMARQSYDAGEYRWVAQVVNHVVFADPDNSGARKLQADALEQLGYQAESGPWRNFYLTGAQELRDGIDTSGGSGSTASPDTVRAMEMDQFFDYLGIHLNGPEAEGEILVINWDFTDTGEQYILRLENSVLDHTANAQDPGANVTVTTTRETLNMLLLKETTLLKAIVSGDLRFSGERLKLVKLFELMDSFDVWFNIVTP